MPVTWSVDRLGRFAVMAITDPYSIEEWRSAVVAMMFATSARPKLSLLVDRRRATPPSSEEVTQMIEFFEKNSSALTGRRAAIVVADDTGFGVARMIELRSRLELPGGTMRVFRRYDDAVTWLTNEPGV